MANVSGQGTIWNLPNYAGELFTASPIQTPFLSIAGGLNGGLQTQDFEFPTASLYALESAAQPAITETASLTAPTALEYVRTQEKNVTQIFQKAVKLSYEKLSNGGRLSGINTQGQVNNAQDELAFQIQRHLEQIAIDVNYTFLNGAYQISTSAAVANKTRGMFAAVTAGGTNVAAAGADLSKDLINQLMRNMANAGARFSDIYMFVSAFDKQNISDIYGYVPTDRNFGGLNINTVLTDFAQVKVVWDKAIPAGSILVADMSMVAPVFQPVPGKGNFFLEQLAKTGASDNYQLYGKIGLDYGAQFCHGSITGLATS